MKYRLLNHPIKKKKLEQIFVINKSQIKPNPTRRLGESNKT